MGPGLTCRGSRERKRAMGEQDRRRDRGVACLQPREVRSAAWLGGCDQDNVP